MPEAAQATIGAVVVYALPGRLHWFETRLAAGSTVGEAIRSCGILDAVPELAAVALDVGVFGRSCALDEPLRDGDRVEIYRPLLVDPKEARRLRADLPRA